MKCIVKECDKKSDLIKLLSYYTEKGPAFIYRCAEHEKKRWEEGLQALKKNKMVYK
jgi:hypothetical protein